MECIKKYTIVAILVVISTVSFGQVTSGKIIFERKTNLKKIFGKDERMKRFITDENKTKIDRFELFFNDSMSAFIPIPDEEESQGFLKYLTSHNQVYQNLNKGEKLSVLDLWGTETFLKDTIAKRQWKVTESKRKIGNYMCRKAIWEMNDSTRIYAWFSVDIVPSIGPEAFSGLPGAILGLATEDGSIIYFAQDVKVMTPKPEIFIKDPGKNDVYTKDELKKQLEVKMGQWMKSKDLDAMFSWL